jgi:hypothetical protein
MATVPKRSDNPDNFDASEFLASRDAHEKNITELNERMSKVEGHLSTPQALAAFFENSAKDSRVLDGVFAQMFCRFIKENDAVKDAVDKRMEEVDRKFFHKFLRRGWLVIYTLAVAVITLALAVLKDWLEAVLIHKP